MELELEGLDNGGTVGELYQRHATALMVEGERERAVESYMAARARGLSDDALGFGVMVLREEGERSIERGYDAFEADAFDQAEAAFRLALEYDPGRHEARALLAQTLARQEQYLSACELWQAVIDGLRAEGEPLPMPVHLQLAQTRALLGQFDEARAPLDAYLAAEPEGEFVDDTRAFLEVLERSTEDG